MESLSHAFQAGDPRCLAVHGALEEVVRLGREIQAVVDYALPQPTRALSCSLLEIARSARGALHPDLRVQVLLAVEDRRSRLTVDGTLLSRSIARLLEAALTETGSPVLLRSRIDGDEAVFALVHAVPPGWNADTGAARFRSPVSTLATELARRDVQRMGGLFAFRRDPDGSAAFELRFPCELPPQERAA